MPPSFADQEALLWLQAMPVPLCVTTCQEALPLAFKNQAFDCLFQPLSGRTQTLQQLLSPQDFEHCQTAALSDTSPMERECKLVLPGGETAWVLLQSCGIQPIANHLLWSFQDITQHKALEQELRTTMDEKKIILQQSGRIFTQYDIPTRTLHQPPYAAEMFGTACTLPNVPYSVADLIFDDDTCRQEYIRFYEAMQQGVPQGSCTLHAKKATGDCTWFNLQYTLIYDQEGQPYRGIITYEDISERQEKELAYKHWQNYFKSQKKNAIFSCEWDLTQDRIHQTWGGESELVDANLGRSFSQRIASAVAQQIPTEGQSRYLAFFCRQSLLAEYCQGRRDFRLEHRRYRRNGTQFWALATIHLVSDPYTGHIMASVIISDIDEEKESWLHMERLSSCDPLTGLLNRHAMVTSVNKILTKSAGDTQHLLLIIDLDHFKEINDTGGHLLGDRVLCRVADTLRQEVRAGDLCGRLGGDEFFVLLKNVVLDKKLQTRLQRLYQRLTDAPPGEPRVGCSIGLASYPRNGQTFEQLYEKADAALYRAKGSGRNQLVFYE